MDEVKNLLVKILHSPPEAGSANKKHSIAEIKVLDGAEFERIKVCHAQFSKFFTIRKFCRIIDLNLEELSRAWIDLGQSYIDTTKPRPNEEAKDEITTRFTAVLFNLMNSYKALLDFGKFTLEHEFGTDSPEATGWQDIQSKCYDASFEYRFFAKLRNYSQHLGLPPLAFSVKIESADTVMVAISLQKSDLLVDKRVWGSFYQELCLQEERIPLLPLVDRWSEVIISVRNYIVDLRLQGCISHAEEILAYRRQLNIAGEFEISLATFTPDGTSDRGLKLQLQSFQELKAYEIMQTFIKIAERG